MKFEANFEVVLDYPFEPKTIHLRFEEWELVPLDCTEEDLEDLDKNISKVNLCKTVRRLAPNKPTQKLGLLITRRD